MELLVYVPILISTELLVYVHTFLYIYGSIGVRTYFIYEIIDVRLYCNIYGIIGVRTFFIIYGIIGVRLYFIIDGIIRVRLF